MKVITEVKINISQVRFRSKSKDDSSLSSVSSVGWAFIAAWGVDLLPPPHPLTAQVTVFPHILEAGRVCGTERERERENPQENNRSMAAAGIRESACNMMWV